MQDKPKITFASNPMYSFYGLWRSCMYNPKGAKEALKGFDDKRLSQIADIIPEKGTKARLMAEKVHQLIGKNNIDNFSGLKTLMSENFDSHEIEKFSTVLEQGFNAYNNFFDKNKETIHKNIEVMNSAQSTYSDNFANLYKCFETPADKKCTCFLNPFPKDKVHDGISNSENVSMDFSLNKTEDKDNYIGDSNILKKKSSTPFHEGTHFLFLNSKLKENIENESSPEIRSVLNKIIPKFEKNLNAADTPSRDKLKYFAVGAINESFAACSSALHREKTTGKATANDNEWYYGWKEANDLTRQMYPTFKEYVSSGKPFDNNFFKKLEISIRADELRRAKNIKEKLEKTGEKIPYNPVKKIDLTSLQMRKQENLKPAKNER